MRSLREYMKSENMINVFSYFSFDEDDKNTMTDILELEWEFFDAVKGINGRAICQDNLDMFIIMRMSQHVIFSKETRVSILKDYLNLRSRGINPIEGKYARMMEHTDEELYKSFLDRLPDVSPIKRQVIIDIINIFDENLLYLQEKLPITMEYSRPRKSKDKSISSLGYFYAELTFFSYRTLRLMKEDVIGMEDIGCVEKIYQNTVIISKYLF